MRSYEYFKGSTQLSYFRLLDTRIRAIQEVEELLGKNNSEIDFHKIYKQAICEVFAELIEHENLDLVINEVDEDGETLLISATHACNIVYVRVLIEKGIDVDIVTDGNCEYALAVALKERWKEGFDYLFSLTHPDLRNYLKDDLEEIGWTEYKSDLLVYNNQISYFRFFHKRRDELEEIEKGLTKDIFKIDWDKINRQAICEVIDELIKSGNLDLVTNEKNPDGESVLMYAVHTRNIDYVRLLIEKGANPNIVSLYRKEYALKIALNEIWEEGFDYLYPLTDPKLRKCMDTE